MTKRKDSKQRASVAKRTLYYYWQCSKKYKWYAIGTIISTPIVVLIRTILIPLIFANMIEVVSAGIPNDQIISTLLPQGLTLIGLYLAGGVILGWLRVRWCWKYELKVNYELAKLCFDAVSAQSMQFHNNRFLAHSCRRLISLSAPLSASSILSLSIFYISCRCLYSSSPY